MPKFIRIPSEYNTTKRNNKQEKRVYELCNKLCKVKKNSPHFIHMSENVIFTKCLK